MKLTYILQHLDNYSHFIKLYLLKNNSHVLPTFNQFKAEKEEQFENKMSRLRSDYGEEYISTELTVPQ